MPDENAGTASAGTEGNSTGAAEGGEQDPNAKLIEDYRKRQAGADAAAATAKRERDDANARYEALLNQKSTKTTDGSAPSAEDIRREVEKEYAQKLSDEVAKARGEALDALYPEARKKFPTVTDAVQLAELQAVFGTENPKPIGNGQQRTGTPAGKSIEDMTSKELQAHMNKTVTREDMGLRPRDW